MKSLVLLALTERVAQTLLDEGSYRDALARSDLSRLNQQRVRKLDCRFHMATHIAKYVDPSIILTTVPAVKFGRNPETAEKPRTVINFGMHCQLLVPDLFWPEREFREIYSKLSTPALIQLLAKGRRRDTQAGSVEAWLCERFEVEKQTDWPVAPYSLLADGGEPGGHHWLRADPVHLRIEGGRLVLVDSNQFSLTQQEADSLCASLDAHFSADGLSFHPLRPERWYLRSEAAPALETTPVAAAAAAGRSIDSLLPRGVDATTWHAHLNDMQMLLHQHPVNAAREDAGNLTINGVWLWGGGRLSNDVSAPFAALWSGDPFAAGLAQAARVATHTLPEDAAGFLRAGAEEGVALIMLDQLHIAARRGDAHAWRESLRQLECDWFAPLLEALRQERIGMLSLHALGPEGVLSAEATRGDLRRFWRRVKPLPAYVKDLR